MADFRSVYWKKCRLVAEFFVSFRESGPLNLMAMSEFFDWKLRHRSVCACAVKIWPHRSPKYPYHIKEIGVVKSNRCVRILIGRSEVAVSVHAQYKFSGNSPERLARRRVERPSSCNASRLLSFLIYTCKTTAHMTLTNCLRNRNSYRVFFRPYDDSSEILYFILCFMLLSSRLIGSQTADQRPVNSIPPVGS